MKKYYKYVYIILFALHSYCVNAQSDSIRLVSPVLKLVSIQPETGYAELSWAVVSSPYIAGFKIQYYDNVSAGFFDLKTLWNPLLTNYIDSSRISRYYSVSYAIEANDRSENPGKRSNSLSTIFTNTTIDTCNSKISVVWNSYSSIPVKVTGYSILVSVNGSSFTEAAAVSSDKNNFTLSDFITNSEYCFVVRANLEDGSVSTSNKACLSTKMQRPPFWINTDQVSVNNENKIDLIYTIDPLSEISHFMLERRSGQSGIFKNVAIPLSVNGKVKFTDNQADHDSIYSYRLSAINNCKNPVMVSDIASNIVLSLEKTGNNLNFSWNSFKKFPEHLLSGKLYINSGTGYNEKSSIAPGDTTFTLDYNQIMYGITDKEVCFYISASETSNPYGVVAESFSSRVCTFPYEVITVPNVFTPNSGTINAFFRPVLSFTPKDYHLVITNRQGKVMFETNDYLSAWDGIQNGTPQAQDVFLWYLKVVTPSGKSISKTGTVTIIRK